MVSIYDCLHYSHTLSLSHTNTYTHTHTILHFLLHRQVLTSMYVLYKPLELLCIVHICMMYFIMELFISIIVLVFVLKVHSVMQFYFYSDIFLQVDVILLKCNNLLLNECSICIRINKPRIKYPSRDRKSQDIMAELQYL